MGAGPLPETRAALSELSRLGDADLVTDLRALTDRARALVPELVGVSLGALREGLTFTFVAKGRTRAFAAVRAATLARICRGEGGYARPDLPR